MKRLFLAVLMALVSSLALAQTPTLTFTAQTTSGDGAVVPVLTWSTSPVAASCVASGDAAWTGPKAVSGTQTLAAVNTSKTYNLFCTWPGSLGTIKLSWVPPTTNTDGSPLTDLASYKLYRSTSSAMSSNVVTTITAPASTYTTDPLTSGDYFFVLSAVNSGGKESDKTAVVKGTAAAVGGPSVTRTVGITVNPVPSAPTGFKVE